MPIFDTINLRLKIGRFLLHQKCPIFILSLRVNWKFSKWKISYLNYNIKEPGKVEKIEKF